MNKFKQYIVDNYGCQGQQWLAELPNLITSIADKYQLSKLEAIEPLSINYVMNGIMRNVIADSEEEILIILKLSINAEDLKRELAALENLPNNVTPKIIAAEDGLLLMERIMPGITLKQYINYQTAKTSHSHERIEISCQLIEQLQENSTLPITDNFPHIEEQLAVLKQEWSQIPSAYLAKARELVDKLLKSLRQKQVQSIFLHGDLHYENIILAKSANSQSERWLTIDPKGVIGYPINEVWAVVIDIVEDTTYIAQYFNFNLKEVREWYFVHLILAACWVEEDKGDVSLFLGYAATAFELISG